MSISNELGLTDYIRMEWEKDTRYYMLEISKDMFGYWIIIRLWRAKHAKTGQTRVIARANA